MGHHTFDADKADNLEDAGSRYRYLSRDELLGALAPSSSDRVADLGSGTGFYTDDVAPYVDYVYGVDVQEAMHDYYREKGVPDNVELITSGVENLPFEDGQLDAAFSTMTYHEFTSGDAIQELSRVLVSGSRIVIADWSADGEGESGPPLKERFTAEEAATALRKGGFDIQYESTRPETFVIVGFRT
ncbi:methyltransferase type 11 [Halogeometricum pallidum JCM 14848]|uniref:Methyltransferase type 11 n=1 Tax=Halogeometricum pallidum JCM 14848 TaxID=1227487 RepID=M0CZL7_HALPD|nr:class I SAM-dependent methyltransferase [Halogeometricum pallidum]ELZ28660.1 methyltransferase type 11 [Halogeometricum pallidum JCM 14848]